MLPITATKEIRNDSKGSVRIVSNMDFCNKFEISSIILLLRLIFATMLAINAKNKREIFCSRFLNNYIKYIYRFCQQHKHILQQLCCCDWFCATNRLEIHVSAYLWCPYYDAFLKYTNFHKTMHKQMCIKIKKQH